MVRRCNLSVRPTSKEVVAASEGMVIGPTLSSLSLSKSSSDLVGGVKMEVNVRVLTSSGKCVCTAEICLQNETRTKSVHSQVYVSMFTVYLCAGFDCKWTK